MVDLNTMLYVEMDGWILKHLKSLDFIPEDEGFLEKIITSNFPPNFPEKNEIALITTDGNLLTIDNLDELVSDFILDISRDGVLDRETLPISMLLELDLEEFKTVVSSFNQNQIYWFNDAVETKINDIESPELLEKEDQYDYNADVIRFREKLEDFSTKRDFVKQLGIKLNKKQMNK